MELKVKIEDIPNFTENYRKYKLDQLDNKNSDYDLEVFRHILEESGVKMSELSDYDWVEISSKEGIIDGGGDSHTNGSHTNDISGFDFEL